MLGEMDDIALARSSGCGGGSDSSGSGFVKPREAGTSEEIGQLGTTLSDNCSQVSAKQRVVTNSRTGCNTWVIGDENLYRGVLSFG